MPRASRTLRAFVKRRRGYIQQPPLLWYHVCVFAVTIVESEIPRGRSEGEGEKEREREREKEGRTELERKVPVRKRRDSRWRIPRWKVKRVSWSVSSVTTPWARLSLWSPDFCQSITSAPDSFTLCSLPSSPSSLSLSLSLSFSFLLSLSLAFYPFTRG